MARAQPTAGHASRAKAIIALLDEGMAPADVAVRLGCSMQAIHAAKGERKRHYFGPGRYFLRADGRLSRVRGRGAPNIAVVTVRAKAVAPADTPPVEQTTTVARPVKSPRAKIDLNRVPSAMETLAASWKGNG